MVSNKSRLRGFLLTRTWNIVKVVTRKQILPQGFPRTDIVLVCSYFESSIDFLGDAIFMIHVLIGGQKWAALRPSRMIFQGCLICERFLAAETGNQIPSPLMGGLDVPSKMCENMKQGLISD